MIKIDTVSVVDGKHYQSKHTKDSHPCDNCDIQKYCNEKPISFALGWSEICDSSLGKDYHFKEVTAFQNGQDVEVLVTFPRGIEKWEPAKYIGKDGIHHAVRTLDGFTDGFTDGRIR